MKTVQLQIEDTIFEQVIAFLNIFPDNKLKVLSEPPHIPFVSEAEQHEIEALLRDSECFEGEKKVTVEL